MMLHVDVVVLKKKHHSICFFDCPHAQAVWRGANLPNLGVINSVMGFEEKIRCIVECNLNTDISPYYRQIPTLDSLAVMEVETLSFMDRNSITGKRMSC